MTASNSYQLFLMGSFRLFCADGTRIPVPAKRSRVLLAMLATSKSGERSRSWLQERIWGSRGRANAQASLRRELSNLRRLVNVGGRTVLIVGQDSVALDLTQIAIDVRDPARVIESRDEFLEGGDIACEEGFEDWLREERQSIALARDASANIADVDRVLAPSHTVNVPEGRPGIIIFVHESGLSPNEAAIWDEFFAYLSESILSLRWLKLVVGPESSTGAPVMRRRRLDHIAKPIGVEYLLSCRAASGDIMVITLNEAATGQVLWSIRQRLEGVGSAVDARRIAADVIAAAAARIESDQIERLHNRPIETLNFDELLWRVRWHNRRLTGQDSKLAKDFLDLAVKAKPGSVDVMVEQAEVEISRIWATASLPKSLDELRGHIELARDIDPYDARCWLLLGVIEMWRGRHDLAATLMEEALNLNPGLSSAYAQLGSCYILRGDPEDGITLINRALRANPQDGRNFSRYGDLALANLMLGNYDQAVIDANAALARRPKYALGYVYKIVAQWLNEKYDEASGVTNELLQAKPEYNVELLKQFPFRDAVWNRTIYASMVSALERNRSLCSAI